MHFLLPLPFFQHAQSSLLGNTARSTVVLSLEALVPGNWKHHSSLKKIRQVYRLRKTGLYGWLKIIQLWPPTKTAFLLLYNCWLLFKLPYISMQRVPYLTWIPKETSSWNPPIEFQRIMEYQMNFNLNWFKLTILWVLWIFTEPVHLDGCSLKPIWR